MKDITGLKIALLGVSHWHVPLYLEGLPENSVVAVSDENARIADQFANALNCTAYTDYRELLSEKQPDFVFAFAPHCEMKQMANDLLDRKIPFSIEKPAGLNAGEVEQLYEKAEQLGAFCAIPFVWRYSDTVNDLKKKYLTSDILHMSYKFVAGPPTRYLNTSKWMLSCEQAGGGCMTNLGVHFIDMALFLTDSKCADTLASIYQYGSEYNIETYASSMLRMETGASFLLESGYAYPMSEESKRENRWTIVTKNGYYILAENSLSIREYGREPEQVFINTDSDVYYPVFARTTLSDFVSGTRPRASLKEMLAVRQILDEMNRKAGMRF